MVIRRTSAVEISIQVVLPGSGTSGAGAAAATSVAAAAASAAGAAASWAKAGTAKATIRPAITRNLAAKQRIAFSIVSYPHKPESRHSRRSHETIQTPCQSALPPTAEDL